VTLACLRVAFAVYQPPRNDLSSGHGPGLYLNRVGLFTHRVSYERFLVIVSFLHRFLLSRAFRTQSQPCQVGGPLACYHIRHKPFLYHNTFPVMETGVTCGLSPPVPFPPFCRAQSGQPRVTTEGGKVLHRNNAQKNGPANCPPKAAGGDRPGRPGRVGVSPPPLPQIRTCPFKAPARQATDSPCAVLPAALLRHFCSGAASYVLPLAGLPCPGVPSLHGSRRSVPPAFRVL